MSKEMRITIRLPQDAWEFLERESKRNLTSKNAEIFRSIRERMVAAFSENRQEITNA